MERKQRMMERVERMGAQMDTIRSGRGDERMQRLLDIEVPETVSVEPAEQMSYTGTSQTPTVFRFDGGEELDWDVIIQSTLEGGKPLGDYEVPEKPTGVQYALKAIFDVWVRDNDKPTKKYQIAWEVDSEDREQMFQPGSHHFFWLKVPQPGKRPRAEYAEYWARAHCKPGGVANMIKCLMQWWAQGITHVRIKAIANRWTNPEGELRTAWPASGITRVEKFYSWDECRGNIRIVQAAYRAMRATCSDQYTDDMTEQFEHEISMSEAEDVSL